MKIIDSIKIFMKFLKDYIFVLMKRYRIYILIIFDILIFDYVILTIVKKSFFLSESNFHFFYFIFIYAELIFIYLIYLIRNIIDLLKINKLMTIIGILNWVYISIIEVINSNILTFALIDKFLVSLATIGTLLVAFIPQGLFAINKKYIPNGRKLYSEYEISKELTKIIYALILFVGVYIFDILLGLFFLRDKSISYYIAIPTYNYLTMIYRYLSTFYMAVLSFGVSMLIYALIKIINIFQYFYFYEHDFEKLKLKYKNLSVWEIDWIIKKKLFNYFMNKYEIKSPEILIDKFDIIAKDNPKYSNKKIIKQILNEDKAGTILVKMHSDKKVK